MSEYAIQMLGITKTFPGIIANDNVDLEVKKNEVLAILGENGAGKSTLMSVLFGAYPPDAGKILINGKEVKITDPNVATKLGIGMVHQHLSWCITILSQRTLFSEGNQGTRLVFFL